MNKAEVEKLLDGPSIVAASGASKAMSSDDRNVRVAALRVVKSIAGRDDFDAASQAEAAEVILKGLQDPKRRVRWNAAKCAGLFLSYPQVVEGLQAITENEQEKRKIRFTALFVLSDSRDLPAPAMDALRDMAEIPKHRATMLLILLRADLTEPVEEMLREFVRGGTREEAVLATRALCGYKVAHIQSLDEEARKALTPEDRAMSSTSNTWWWVRRD